MCHSTPIGRCFAASQVGDVSQHPKWEEVCDGISRISTFSDAPSRDEVEEVLARVRPLQHQDEGVCALVQVQQPDDARDAVDGAEEAHLQRDPAAAHLKRKKKKGYQSCHLCQVGLEAL